MSKKFNSKRPDLLHNNIPAKANFILNLVLFTFVIIVIRIWYLAVVQYDEKLEESRKPQKKTIIEPATRATIRDRFNLPLAINKIQYQATILYSQIKDIPTSEWVKDANGKKIKKPKRKEYIKQLSELLANELNLDAERIEDLIYAKASFYSQVPFIIKDELTEVEYYRLKNLERNWPGIYVRKLPKRFYPRGRTAGDVIGYMGAINKQEYERILQEMKILEQLINEPSEEWSEFPPGIESIAQARKRLRDLQEKAYTIYDYIGKTGIEGNFEKQLRGFYGKKNYHSDSKGNYLRELPGSRPPLSGQRILLTISAELQEYAEQLLAQNENIRIVRLSRIAEIKKTILAMKHPWIKGGAIVVMDPQNGEILTLATYPRFDPNDFISSSHPEINKEKHKRINRWFENESYLASLWNQQQPLEREAYNEITNEFYDEKKIINWNTFLQLVLPKDSVLRKVMINISKLEQALEVDKATEDLLKLFPGRSFYQIINVLYSNNDFHVEHKPSSYEKKILEAIYQENREETKKIKKKLDRYFELIPHNYDKVLLIDLCRLAVSRENFSDELIEKSGHISLQAYKNASCSFFNVFATLKEMMKEAYHDIDFKNWRIHEEKDFLKEKRIEEKKRKTYPKPYLDYIDKFENVSFQQFWEEYKWILLESFLMGKTEEELNFESLFPYFSILKQWYQEIVSGAHQNLDWRESFMTLQETLEGLNSRLAIEFLRTMRSYHHLNRSLLGSYRGLRENKKQLEKHLASSFYPAYGFGCGRSYAYRQAAIQGSIFKLITAYEALVQNLKRLNREEAIFKEINPLIITDQVYTVGTTSYVGYTQDKKPIPQHYKGGRIPRSLAHQNNGEVDLIKALEVSSNPYFALLAGECLENPNDLAQAARLFSYGSRTGLDLPGEINGKIPDDLERNRTGLYALAIGQHSLVVTPLQTAVMLATIANGGKVLKPKIVSLTAGRQPTREEEIAPYDTFAYQNELAMVGIDFPLFIASNSQHQKNFIHKFPTEIVREVWMPNTVRQILLKSLKQVVNRTYQESVASLSRLYSEHPEAMQDFAEMKPHFAGKTSTSESVETIDLDLNEGTNIYTHVWFGGILFQNKNSTQNASTFIMKDEFGQPELIVVVYLRYGGYGKEAAPIAAQIAKKWREISSNH